ncbi:MAG: hypothetical protein JNL21_39980 [Myxococcales bacterium]|nr:hypothetical protein [Myxococcales bacterium]
MSRDRRALAALLVLLASACGAPAKPEAPVPSAALEVQTVEGLSPPMSSFVAGSAPPEVRTLPFRVSSLPTFVTGHTSDKAPERRADDVQVERSGETAVITLRRREGRVGRLLLDSTAPVSLGGLQVRCGQWAAANLTMHMLDIRADGSALFTRVEGIFDASACEAVERARVSFEPKTLVPGYLYAFRVCTATPCGAGQERVSFLMPSTAVLEMDGMISGAQPAPPEPLVIASYIVERGSTGTFSAVVNEAALRVLFASPPSFVGDAPMFVGVDIGSASGEAEPVAVASFGPVRNGPTPRPVPEPFH